MELEVFWRSSELVGDVSEQVGGRGRYVGWIEEELGEDSGPWVPLRNLRSLVELTGFQRGCYSLVPCQLDHVGSSRTIPQSTVVCRWLL